MTDDKCDKERCGVVDVFGLKGASQYIARKAMKKSVLMHREME